MWLKTATLNYIKDGQNNLEIRSLNGIFLKEAPLSLTAKFQFNRHEKIIKNLKSYFRVKYDVHLRAQFLILT